MSKMVEKFKENKKVMMTKMDMAAKMAADTADEFVESIESLVKDASEEEIKEFWNAKDEIIDMEDKMAILAAYAETHDDIAGIIIAGRV